MLQYHLFCMLSLHSVQISINFTKDSSFYTKWGYSEKYARETQMITTPDTIFGRRKKRKVNLWYFNSCPKCSQAPVGIDVIILAPIILAPIIMAPPKDPRHSLAAAARMVVRSDKKLSRCRQCAKSFTSCHDLKMHMVKIHGSTMISGTSPPAPANLPQVLKPFF